MTTACFLFTFANVILFLFFKSRQTNSSLICISISEKKKEEEEKYVKTQRKKTLLFTFYVMFYKIVNGNWISSLFFPSSISAAAIAISIHLINRMKLWVDAFAALNGFNFITCESTRSNQELSGMLGARNRDLIDILLSLLRFEMHQFQCKYGIKCVFASHSKLVMANSILISFSFHLKEMLWVELNIPMKKKTHFFKTRYITIKQR